MYRGVSCVCAVPVGRHSLPAVCWRCPPVRRRYAPTAAHRAPGPGGGGPSFARGAAAWVRTDADDGRGAVVCPLIGATRLSGIL